MRSSSGDREILDGLTHPVPPADLRGRTLAAARLSAAAQHPSPPWQAILAFFGAQRGWTAALVVLLAAHLVLGSFREGSRSARAMLPRNVEVAAQPDLLRLPRVKDLAHRPPAVPIEKTRVEGDFS